MLGPRDVPGRRQLPLPTGLGWSSLQYPVPRHRRQNRCVGREGRGAGGGQEEVEEEEFNQRSAVVEESHVIKHLKGE